MDHYHVTFLEILTVFCIMLAIPFPVMWFVFSRRMMTQRAKRLPHDQVSSVLLDTLPGPIIQDGDASTTEASIELPGIL
jgi:hypothetical protein